MGILLEPGVAVEAGRSAVLISPPGFLVDLGGITIERCPPVPAMG